MESLSFHYAHIYLTFGNIVLTTSGLGALIAFYFQFKSHMSPNKPTLQLLAFKLEAMVDLTQSIVFSFLAGRHAYTPGGYLTKQDYLYGIPSFLLAVEQVFFALAFFKVFSSKKYNSKGHQQQIPEPMPFSMALLDVLNSMDLFAAVVKAFQLTDRMWKRDERGVRAYHYKKATELREG